MKRKVIIFTFIIYCLLLAYCLFKRTPFDIGKPYFEEILMNINIVPFSSISQFWGLITGKTSSYLFNYALVNFAGNIVAFIPLGIYLPIIFKKFRNFLKFAFGTVIVILLVETVQLFTLTGSFDVDDIILNVAGACVGYLCYYLVKLCYIKHMKKNKPLHDGALRNENKVTL